MALDILGPANAPNSTTARPPDDRSFGTTDTWFKDCSSSVANDGTKLKAAFMNAVSGAFRALIRGNGNTALAAPIVSENNADDALALKSIQHLIQRGKPSFATASGTANALVVALTPACAEYFDGLEVRVKIATANTAAATLNINGLGAVAVVRNEDGAALKPGDLPAGSICTFGHDGTTWRLRTAVPSVGARGFRSHQGWFAAGSFTWICPAGVTQVLGRVWGGGGGGGGTGFQGAAGGGAAGGFAEGYVPVVPGASYSVVVGAGGALGQNGSVSIVANNGGGGGASSFAGVLSATGGLGGGGALSGTQGAANSPGVGSGGYENLQGGNGNSGFYTGSFGFAGMGGTAPGGGGGGAASTGQPNAGFAPGGGGGGGGSSWPGAAGAQGGVIIFW